MLSNVARIPLAEALLNIPATGEDSDFQLDDNSGHGDVFN